GVQTGVIFGEYAYGDALGFKIAEVPLVIGTNWLMLSYLCGSVTDRLPVALIAKVLMAAGLMTLLDFVIEPVAIRLDFWQWQGDTIPLQNYLAWYSISAGLFFIYFKMPFRKQNILAPLLLVLQFLFFGLNSLLHWLD
uniref:carotenoid biosynthesis protein n=1 Tax=Persicitalea sp. TaxID=3100273 RepID=UPI003593F287